MAATARAFAPAALVVAALVAGCQNGQSDFGPKTGVGAALGAGESGVSATGL